MLKESIANKYWITKLSGVLPKVDLYKFENLTGLTKEKLEIEISVVAFEKINRLTDGSEIGQYIYFLTALATVLNKYSDSKDVLVTTGSFNLNASQKSNSRLLFLRSNFSSDLKIRDLLNAFRTTVVEAYRYQDFSYKEVITSLGHNNESIDELLFQIGLFDGRVNTVPEEVEDKCPLWIKIIPSKSTLLFSFNYTYPYSQLFIEQFAKHFVKICNELVDHIEYTTKNIKILLKEEEEQVLYSFKGACKENSGLVSLGDMFTVATSRNFNATAVAQKEKKLTYKQLEQYSDVFASYLIGKYGIKKGSAIAISLSSSFELVIAIISALKIGAIVVPIDTVVPALRKDFIIEDSGASILIAENNRTDSRVPCIDKDVINKVIHSHQVSKLPKVYPEDIAYVIYTSGSSGVSKGVKITHENILNQFEWFKNYFNFLPSDILPQKTTIGFVDSILELLFPITSGNSSVYLRPYNEIINDIPEFINWLAQIDTSIVQFVPSVFNYIQRIADVSCLKKLRVLILTGEELKQTYDFTFPVYNIYGNSECTAYSLIYKLNGKETGKIPIGKPIDNTSIYVLGDDNEPLPFFITGEIFIGGKTVSSGYLNRPELSSERFINDIFFPENIMYKTGDLGRLLPNGEVEFMGRKDRQLKIRGQRVEPGEIENTILSHPAIKEVVVWNSGDEKDDPGLSAFYTIKDEIGYTITKINQLKKINPELVNNLHYLPNDIVILPLNKRESELLYNEIFLDNTYIKNGLIINEGDIIFDVGANIGLFTLYAGLNFKNTRIYALEPIKPLYDALSINVSLYDIDVTLYNMELSEQEKTVEFNYYGSKSVLSDTYSAERVENYSGDTNANSTEVERNEIVGEQIGYENYTCKARRLSDVIRENKIVRIDFLKIDIKANELELIQGVDSEHWPLIQQVVIKVHNIESGGQIITNILNEQGFSLYIEQADLSENANTLNIYASRILNKTSQLPPALNLNNFGLYTKSESIVEQVTNSCKANLPFYMVPSQFKILEAIPRLDNGKVDRKILEQIQKGDPEENEKLVLPRNITEETLLEMFTNILNKNGLGVRDSFFKNGGHSLSATKLNLRIMKVFKVDVTLREIFDNTTVEMLAKIVLSKELAPYRGIKKADIQENYPTSFNQKRLWVISQMEEMNLAYNVNGTFLLLGGLNTVALEKAFFHLIEKHEILRTFFVNERGIPMQKIAEPSKNNFRIEYKDFRNEPNQNALVSATIKEYSSVLFNLSNLPLLKVLCVTLKDSKYLLVVTIHHIISDGWSVKLMIEEILFMYDQYMNKGEISTNKLEIQYKDYAVWYTKLVSSGKLSNQKEYWLEKFKNKVRPLKLIYDFPIKSNISSAGDSFKFIFEGKQLELLRDFCTKENVTPFVIFFAVLNVLMAIETKQQEICLGIPAAGRQENSLDSQIGFYVNLLPLVTVIQEEISFKSLLISVGEEIIKALQNQLFPFDLLMEDKHFIREDGRSEFVKAGFTWDTVENVIFHSSSDLRIKLIDTPVTNVKHDLWLIGNENPSHIDFTFEYRTELFKKETIALLSKKFIILLEKLIAFPQMPVKGHNIMSYSDNQLKEKVVEIDLDI
jgi:amino acid adenylation domain-containing protein/FkbM family methyltransferase